MIILPERPSSKEFNRADGNRIPGVDQRCPDLRVGGGDDPRIEPAADGVYGNNDRLPLRPNPDTVATNSIPHVD